MPALHQEILQTLKIRIQRRQNQRRVHEHLFQRQVNHKPKQNQVKRQHQTFILWAESLVYRRNQQPERLWRNLIWFCRYHHQPRSWKFVKGTLRGVPLRSGDRQPVREEEDKDQEAHLHSVGPEIPSLLHQQDWVQRARKAGAKKRGKAVIWLCDLPGQLYGEVQRRDIRQHRNNNGTLAEEEHAAKEA